MVLRRLRPAWRGLSWAVRQQAVAGHLVAAAFVLALGVLVCLPAASWALVVLVIGVVIGAELLNTAVEVLGDAVGPQRRPVVGRAKDVAAAGVLATAVAAALFGLFVFLPPLLAGTTGSCHR